MPEKTLSEEKKVEFAMDAWKTSIQVQQHFNTIEMQIRSLAITVLTAAIGAAIIIYNQLQSVPSIREGDIPCLSIWFLKVGPADLLVFAGLMAWGAFYFMERYWYHKLLIGAVKNAKGIEDELQKEIPGIRLSTFIGKESPLKFFGKWELHSKQKIDMFYGVVAIILIIIIIGIF